MTTPPPGETYEKILTANLQRAIDFLKYAEAKNAALLALSSAWVVAMINLLTGGKTIPSGMNISILLALVLALCAGILAMLSFMPRLHLPSFLGGHRAGPHLKNLLYYGDIAYLPIKTLEKDLRDRYMPDAGGMKADYIHDLVVQLSVNSDIALQKMKVFRWGIGLILIAGIILLIPALGMAIGSLKQLW